MSRRQSGSQVAAAREAATQWVKVETVFSLSPFPRISDEAGRGA